MSLLSRIVYSISIGLFLLGCGGGGGGSSAPVIQAPTALIYSSNPAIYTKGTAITANSPSSSGGAATSYSVNPPLPVGLSFNTSTGVVSGAPTVVAATAAYIVTATNGGGSTTASLTITVNDVAPSSLTYSTNPATYIKGTTITANTPSSSGGAVVSYSVSPSLPTGLSLNTSTGAINGTPTAVTAAGSYTVTATNSGGAATTHLTITVNDAAPSNLTYGTNPAAYTKSLTISSNSPSNSGGAVLSYAVVPALPAGLSMSTSTGVVTGTPTAVTASAPYTVTATNITGTANANLVIAVNDAPPTNLTYTAAASVYTKGTAITSNSPAASGGAVVSYSVSPSLPGGLSLSTATGVISGTPTVLAPQADYTVTATNSGGIAKVALTITVKDVAPTNLTYWASTAVYTKGTVIASNTPSYSGGTVVSYSISPGLSAGLSLNTSTGIITGTPTAVAATASYTVAATNTGGSITVGLTITVNDVAPSSLVYLTNPAVYTKGVAIPSNSPGNSGGAVVSYSANPSLPAGMSLNTSTGDISGIPAAITAPAAYTVTATNSGGSTAAIVTITVNDVAPSNLSYSNNSLILTTDNVTATSAPSHDGGVVTSYAVLPSLPSGLALNANTGVISGTPTVVSNLNHYTVTASNSGGSTTTVLDITVVAPPTITSFTASANRLAGGQVTTASAVFTGGSAVLTPGNRIVQSGAVIQLQPLQDTLYRVTVTNAAGMRVSASYQIFANPVIALDRNSSSVFVRRPDGTVWAWGQNSYGELGDGTWIDRSTPLLFPLSGSVTAHIANSGSIGLIDGLGQVWTCGRGPSGIGAESYNIGHTTPVRTDSLPSIKDLTIGSFHVMALTTQGTVWSWGQNFWGCLGDGTRTPRNFPAMVPGLTGVVAVAANDNASYIVRNDGTVWAWGFNADGLLGIGTTTETLAPTQIPGLSGIVSIVVDPSMYAIDSDGLVWSWGQNTSGQLGDGTTTNRTTPTRVIGLDQISSLSIGGGHVLALKRDGSVWSWGLNTHGQLGTGGTNESHIAQPVTGLPKVSSIFASPGASSYALGEDGSLWAWGSNSSGQLGDGSGVSQVIPVRVKPGIAFQSLAVSNAYAVGLETDGVLSTWGDDSDGQLGVGTAVYQRTPIATPHASLTQLNPGYWQSYIFDTGENVLGFGATQPWSGGLPLVSTPTIQLGLSGFNHISIVPNLALALKPDGTLWAAGQNGYGQLGDGTTISSTKFQQVPGFTGGIACRASWDGWSMALRSDGTVWTWGYGGAGNLGDGTSTNRTTPAAVPISNVIAIANGPLLAVALKADGTVWWWGYSYPRRITTPTQISGLDNIVSIAVCWDCVVALKGDGTVWAFGRISESGGSVTYSTSTLIQGFSSITAIDAGSGHVMGLRSDGTLWTFGDNTSGQLGIGGTQSQFTFAVPVPGVNGITLIGAGLWHNLAWGSGTLYSWGKDTCGQLGIGRVLYTLDPVVVSDFVWE